MLTGIGLTAAALASLALGAGARDGECADERATNVDARVVDAGHKTRCGIGVSIFGLRLAVLGPVCPDYKLHYPAHGECLGEPAEGMECVPAGTLEVRFEKCTCAQVTLLGTGLLVPDCVCAWQPGNMGFIENFKTKECDE